MMPPWMTQTASSSRARTGAIARSARCGEIAALAARTDRGFAVLRAPVLKFRVVLELLIAAHFKMAEVDFAQVGEHFVRAVSKQNGKRLLGAEHSAGVVVFGFRNDGRIAAQRGDADVGQGKVCASIVEIFQVAFGFSMADESQVYSSPRYDMK